MAYALKKFNPELFLSVLEGLRKRDNLSKGEFGEKIGIKNYYSNYSRGKTEQPKVNTLIDICNLYEGVTLDLLVTGHEPPFVQASQGIFVDKTAGDTVKPEEVTAADLEKRLASFKRELLEELKANFKDEIRNLEKRLPIQPTETVGDGNETHDP